MTRADIEAAERAYERAHRAYLNGPVARRHELRAAFVAASERLHEARTGRVETLSERYRRLTR